MYQVSVKEGATQWETLIQAALNGEEIVIMQDEKPIIKWMVVKQQKRPRFGSGKHLDIVMSDDFDEPPDFAEYM
jgi:antitoxin (DNA-binding transcriptional repressor) of toxin-antitoxin stability system